MKMLQTMSLAGSVVLIFYVVTKMCGRKAFTYSYYKKILMLAMVFFLFPLPEFIYLYADLLKTIFPIEEWGLGRYLPYGEWGTPVEHYIEYTKDGQFRINHPEFYIVSIVCIAIMLFWLIRYFYKSQKIRKTIVQRAESVRWNAFYKQYDELKNNMKIKRCIEVRVSEDINSPITMGVKRPIIFLPKNMYDVKNMNFMLSHELNHIRQKDMFFTIICLAVLMLNLYNPVAYYLVYEWKRVVELACDEKVMECMSDAERKKYGLLIVDMAEKEMFVQPTYLLGFGLTRKKLIEERVENAMNKRKMNGFKRVVAGSIMLVVAFVSSLTVFAYEPDVLWEVEELHDSETEIVFLTEEMFEEEMQNRTVKMDGETITYKTKGYEKEFVYVDTNNQVIVEEGKEGTVSAKSVCKHVYVSGVQTEHRKVGKEGCRITYYKVTRCKTCYQVKSKTYYKADDSDVCTH